MSENFLFFPILVIIFVNIFFIWSNLKFLKFGNDNSEGIQKIHSGSSLRVGGMSFYISFSLTVYCFSDFNNLFLIIICIFPTFFVGAVEDIFQTTTIQFRLLGSLLSSILLIFFNGSIVTNIDMPLVQTIFSNYYFAVFFTLIGYLSITNAFNFIDGLNGLSSGLSLIIVGTFSYISYNYSNFDLYYISVIFIFGLLPFWLFNIFTGKIFLGDSGSYVVGIFIGWLGVELVYREQSFSPWFVFFIILYPATELIVSVIRRLVKKRSPFKPDNEHLHTMFFYFLKSVMRNYNNKIINSIAGTFLVLYGSIPSLYILLYLNELNIIFIEIFLYFSSYCLLFGFLKIRMTK